MQVFVLEYRGQVYFEIGKDYEEAQNSLRDKKYKELAEAAIMLKRAKDRYQNALQDIEDAEEAKVETIEERETRLGKAKLHASLELEQIKLKVIQKKKHD